MQICNLAEMVKRMVILNKNDKPFDLKVDRFDQVMKGITSGKEVLTGKSISWEEAISLTPKSSMIIELN